MKNGAIFGALIGLFVYMMLPIYGNNGMEATLLPTGHVISDPHAYNNYVSNLPFSTVIFFALEILGIALGITAEIVIGRSVKNI